jgi:L-aminopeptidase/D-esterase-like protein
VRADVSSVGAAAATALARAVLAAVREATSLAGVPAVRDLERGAVPAPGEAAS